MRARVFPLGVLTALGIFLGGSGISRLQAQVQIDMSNAFNYDAVGTADEVNWSSAANFPSQNRRLTDTIGQHSLSAGGLNNTGRVYVNQSSLTGTNVGLPDTGLLGDYAISQNFQNGNAIDGFDPAFNAARVTATSTGASLTSSITITLDLSQQASYSDFNLLFVQGRTTSTGSYRTVITATYTDMTSVNVFDTGLFVAGAAGVAGGTMGSAGVGGGGFSSGTDPSAAVSTVLSATSQIRTTGSVGVNTAASTIDNGAPSYLWELTDPVALDETKVLQSLTFSVTAVSNGRFNDLVIFGINASAVPEPAVGSLAVMGLAALVFRRRSRGGLSFQEPV